ncbi:MAG: sirohydrochlorin cobaltochelatase [Desulfobaccales bacterium]
MVKRSKSGWLWLALIVAMLGAPWTLNAAAAPKPAIVLAAFGTTTNAFPTYQKIEDQVKERFPGYEIRWAFTSNMVRHKVLEEQHKELKSLPEVLQGLKAEGLTRVAIQSLLLAPGKEWEGVVRQSREVPGLTVAVGRPLLSGKADEVRVLAALSKEFPADLKKNAVVLVGHGSPDPQAQAAYDSFAQLLHSRYPGGNVFFGMVEFEKPGKEEVLQEIKQSGATSVKIIPFLLVAGDHVQHDILGAGPKSWKSDLLKMGNYQVEGVRQGLGEQKEIVNIYLEHLTEALQKFQEVR